MLAGEGGCSAQPVRTLVTRYQVDGSLINPFPVQFYRGSADLGTRAGPSLLEGWSITSPSAVTPSTFGRGLR